VYAADENDFDADCFVRIGIVWPERDKPLEWFLPTPQLIRGRTYTIAVVPVNADGAGIDPTAAPQAAGVSLGDTGQVPPDVADFDALVECCDLVFTWTPVTDTRNDVAYYEIRQGAAFAGGAFVGRAWGWNNGLLIVPIGLVPNALVAPNDEFHIKAITGLGAESTLEGSDTLTTIQIACLQAFCCGKARELTPTPGSDTILITSLAPTPGGIPPIINIGGGGGNPGPNGVISGGIDPTSFVANGSRWDYTILLDDTAVVGDRVMVLESVRLV